MNWRVLVVLVCVVAVIFLLTFFLSWFSSGYWRSVGYLEILLTGFYFLVGFSLVLMAYLLYEDKENLNRLTNEKKRLEERISELERKEKEAN
jgi:membrane protein implicated in regulation of membrane protease activity